VFSFQALALACSGKFGLCFPDFILNLFLVNFMLRYSFSSPSFSAMPILSSSGRAAVLFLLNRNAFTPPFMFFWLLFFLFLNLFLGKIYFPNQSRAGQFYFGPF